MRRVKVDMKWVAVLAVATVAAVLVAVLAAPRDEQGRSALTPSAVEVSGSQQTPEVRAPRNDDGPVTTADASVEAGMEAVPVDLPALRARLPDNLYWELGAPTGDEEVVRRRAEHARRTNATWGRILAGEASDDELEAYFAGQRRLHQDYVTLCRTVLAEQGERLSERDRGLYELGERMHRQRLEELDRVESDARERKKLQDERRAEWEREGKPVPSAP